MGDYVCPTARIGHKHSKQDIVLLAFTAVAEKGTIGPKKGGIANRAAPGPRLLIGSSLGAKRGLGIL